MAVDAAGNYLFSVDGRDYRVQKMDYFEQTRIINLMSTAEDPFSDAFINAQREIFPLIRHKVSESEYKPLDAGYLMIHLNSIGDKTYDVGINLFMKITEELIGNFTGTDVEPSQAVLGQSQEKESNHQDSTGQLQETLNRQRQML